MGNTLKPQKQHPSSMTTEAARLVTAAVSTSPIVIFSKTYCPYCTSAKRDIKAALTALNLRTAVTAGMPTVFELDNMSTLGREVQAHLARETRRRTVPNVFVAGVSVGGGDEIARLAARGKLVPLLRDAVREFAPAPAPAPAPPTESQPQPQPQPQAAAVPASGSTHADGTDGNAIVAREAPAHAIDSGEAPAHAIDGDEAPAHAIDGGEAPVHAIDGDEAPAHAIDGGEAPAHAIDGSEAPAHAIEGDEAPTDGTPGGDLATNGVHALDTEAAEPEPEPEPEDEDEGEQEEEADQQVEQEDSVQAFVEGELKKGGILMFSKSYCPFCAQAKAVLRNAGAEVGGAPAVVHELNELGERGAAMQAYLLQRTGQRTVPNVFIGGRHIGGCSEVMALASSGTLVSMLQDVVASA